MNQTEAVVACVEGEDVWLELCQPSECSTCISAEGCGHGGKPKLRKLRNSIGAQVGDRVLISIPTGAVVKVALLSYLMPLVLGLILAGLGMQMQGEIGALAGLLIGLIAGLAALRTIGSGVSRRAEPLLKLSVQSATVQLHRNSGS